MNIIPKVIVNLKGLLGFESQIKRDLRYASSGPIRKALKQWAIRYRAWSQTRFVKLSRGGGDWPPLKSKRRRGSTSRAAILRDTGTLFAALTPTFVSKPGQYERISGFGVEVGFVGGHHPSSSGVSVGDIASFHHFGLGNNPERKILDDPPLSLINQMKGDMDRALIEIAKSHDSV